MDIPSNMQELEDALKQVPAFALSFTLLAYFWFAHHTWSRRYGLDNGASVCLSLFLVFMVLVWVYPLRVVFGAATSWFSQLALPSSMHIPFSFQIGGLDDLRFMFIVYGMAWSSLGVIVALLYRQGWKHRENLALNRVNAWPPARRSPAGYGFP